jgi:hypothetical protein
MFGNKNTTPCTVTVEELPDVCDDILISTNEYKELLRKEVAMDIICSIANDQAAKEELRYSWDTALRLILKHALPEKFVPDEPEAEEDGEGDA